MATNYYNFKGLAKWAKVYEPDSYSGAENWKINLYFKDDKELSNFQKTGLDLKIRDDKDGEGKYVTFRRPTKKTIKDDIIFFCPPAIRGKVSVNYLNDNDEVIRQYVKGEYKGKVTRDGDAVLIGNGSKISVNVCIYDTAKGKGHRLESITVYELVDYKEVDSYDDESEEVVVEKEEPKVEEVKEVKKEARKIPTEEELSDSLPW